jgi:hypothetical protein
MLKALSKRMSWQQAFGGHETVELFHYEIPECLIKVHAACYTDIGNQGSFKGSSELEW